MQQGVPGQSAASVELVLLCWLLLGGGIYCLQQQCAVPCRLWMWWLGCVPAKNNGVNMWCNIIGKPWNVVLGLCACSLWPRQLLVRMLSCPLLTTHLLVRLQPMA